MRLIGLMSGTSADGIDAAVVDITGEGRQTRLALLATTATPFSAALRTEILEIASGQAGAQRICALDAVLGGLFAQAAIKAATAAGVALNTISAIASHGQTVWHQPEIIPIAETAARGTLQLGTPAIIAARTGLQVVSDFRSADMAAGGQGAPLVPFADWALLTSEQETRAIQNIGGIANVTYLPRGAEIHDVVAFDTGPGNMVIDSVASLLSEGEKAFDDGGEIAASGTVDSRLLDRLLEHPYFQLPPPKSTGRELFGRPYAEQLIAEGRRLSLSDRDIIATATMLTAHTIADAYAAWLLSRGTIEVVILGGGGARNKTLVRMLTELMPASRVTFHEELGIPSDAKEAMAFALLGYETLCGRPSNVPSATGAGKRTVLGSITPAPAN